MELMPERQCAKCGDRQKWEWGCTKDAKGSPVTFDGTVLKRCPRRPLLEDPAFYAELFWLYRQYVAKGTLPEPGGLEDQPALLMDAFRIVETTLAYTDRVNHEREVARRKRLDKHGRR